MADADGMSDLRQRAVHRGWLREGERPVIARLTYPLAEGHREMMHEANVSIRDAVVEDMLCGAALPMANPSCLMDEDEVTVAEVDRYNIPLRTVLGVRSGLLRSDPYYSEEYLGAFYRDYYRSLYRPKRFSLAWFLAEQVRHGQRILEQVAARLRKGARVLDIGCGMGGMLVPFAFEGCQVMGFDYGDDYAGRGRQLALDIRTGGFETVRGEAPFDLIMMSHVLEHARDPIEFARQAAELLREDGTCYIELPGLLNIAVQYKGDLLTYLQNAHRWHFTSGTLRAVLARAGLAVERSDETICCLTRRAAPDSTATAQEGPSVLALVQDLEQKFCAVQTAAARA